MTKVHTTASPRPYIHELKPQESQDLGSLITKVGTKSIFWIGFHVGELEGYRDRLGHLHPFTFMEAIFKDATLSCHLKGVRSKGGLVWKPFTQKLQENINQEKAHGNIDCHVDAFASAINRSADTIRRYLKVGKIDQFLIKELCNKV